MYDGPEIKYPQLSAGEVLEVRLYAWEPVGEEYEVCFEICSGEFEGRVVKAYVSSDQKADVHRSHRYAMEVGEVHTHHVRANWFEEVPLDDKK